MYIIYSLTRFKFLAFFLFYIFVFLFYFQKFPQSLYPLILLSFLYLRLEKAVAPHSSTLDWKIHGRRCLEGCSPWSCWGSDTTEQLHFSLSCIGEGNGNPLQCSYLENPRDEGAWWAAVYGVAQNRTRLKRLSSSSSSCAFNFQELSFFIWMLLFMYVF